MTPDSTHQLSRPPINWWLPLAVGLGLAFWLWAAWRIL